MKQALQRLSRKHGAAAIKPRTFVRFCLLSSLFLMSRLGSRNPVFAGLPRLPLQTELFGHQIAGEVVFQELQKTLGGADSARPATYLKFTRTLPPPGVSWLTLQRVLGLAVASHSDPGKASRVRGPSGLFHLADSCLRIRSACDHSDPWGRRLGILTISIVALTFRVCNLQLVLNRMSGSA